LGAKAESDEEGGVFTWRAGFGIPTFQDGEGPTEVQCKRRSGSIITKYRGFTQSISVGGWRQELNRYLVSGAARNHAEDPYEDVEGGRLCH